MVSERVALATAKDIIGNVVRIDNSNRCCEFLPVIVARQRGIKGF
jgi:hypothetical protein